jgi:hypothetical protein
VKVSPVPMAERSEARTAIVGSNLCCAALCVGRGLASGQSPVEGVLSTGQHIHKFHKTNSEPEQSKRPNP